MWNCINLYNNIPLCYKLNTINSLNKIKEFCNPILNSNFCNLSYEKISLNFQNIEKDWFNIFLKTNHNKNSNLNYESIEIINYNDIV